MGSSGLAREVLDGRTIKGPWPWVNLVCAFLLVAGVVQLLVFWGFEVLQIHTPFSQNFGEGHVLWMAMQITNPHGAFQSLDRMPYVFYPYTPVYMLAARLLSFGDLLMTGRWLSLFSTLALAGIAGATVFACFPKASTRWRLAAASVSVGLLLTRTCVITWAPLMRVDMLALLFTFAGLAVFVLWGSRPLGLYAAMVLFVLGVFTRQVCIAAPVACFLVGILGNYRAMLRATSVAVLLGLAGLAGCTLFYGKLFLSHTFLYNVAPFNVRHGLLAPLYHVIAGLPFVIAAVASAVALGKRAAGSQNQSRNPDGVSKSGHECIPQGLNPASFSAHYGTAEAEPFQNGPEDSSSWTVSETGLLPWLKERVQTNFHDRAVAVGCIYFAIATAMLPLIGKRGSDVNYLLEWDIASAFLAGLFVLNLMNASEQKAVWKPTRILAFLLMPAMLVFAMVDVDRGMLTTVLTHNAAQNIPAAQAARVVEMIKATSGPVLSEDMLLSIMGGKAPVMEMAGLNFLRMKGRWDERPLVQMIDEGQFGLIVSSDITNPDRYSPAMTAAINKEYVLSEHVGIYSIYRPRGAAFTM